MTRLLMPLLTVSALALMAAISLPAQAQESVFEIGTRSDTMPDVSEYQSIRKGLLLKEEDGCGTAFPSFAASGALALSTD